MSAEQLDLLRSVREQREEMAKLKDAERQVRPLFESIYSKLEKIVSLGHPEENVNMAEQDEDPIILHIVYDFSATGSGPIRLALFDLRQSLTVYPNSCGQIQVSPEWPNQGHKKLVTLEEAKAYDALVDKAIERLATRPNLPRVSQAPTP